MVRVLALTNYEYNPTRNFMTEADTAFNPNYAWNSYRGALFPRSMDFRRVGLHELRHVSDELLLLDSSLPDAKLAERVHLLLQNAQEIEGMTRRGIEAIAKRFSAKEQCQILEQTYLNLLHSKKLID
jgi:hypothetical protein